LGANAGGSAFDVGGIVMSTKEQEEREGMGRRLRIATRGSDLALAQARQVQAAGLRVLPGWRMELKIVETTGDRRQKASLAGGGKMELPKGWFTKELEEALLKGEADVAVHSLKDLPTQLPPGLRLGAVLERVDVRDVWISREQEGTAWGHLRAGTRVATSSTRRAAEARRRHPGIEVVEIRGNVPTRLRKVAETTAWEGTLLAAAGLGRLGIGIGDEGRVTWPESLGPASWVGGLRAERIPAEDLIPAPGQAAIGIECRQGDRAAARLCRLLEDAPSRLCVDVERSFLAGYGGGCHSPVAAWAVSEGAGVRLRVRVFEGDRLWERTAWLAGNRARRGAWGLGREARRELGRQD
jgi:hydroxymethylbilane synthase